MRRDYSDPTRPFCDDDTQETVIFRWAEYQLTFLTVPVLSSDLYRCDLECLFYIFC